MALIPKFFMGAVASIGQRNGASVNWIGAGSFVIKSVGNDRFLPFMVTNRHVLEGKKAMVIRLKEKNTEQLRVIDKRKLAHVPLSSVGSFFVFAQRCAR